MYNIFTVAYNAVDQMSTERVLTIGGAGSVASVGASVVTSQSVDADMHWVILTLGLISALLSVGLLVMKSVQQRREMKVWTRDNACEHAEIHHEIDEIKGRCLTCGHHIDDSEVDDDFEAKH